MLSMEYCTGLFVWGLEVCAHLVVVGVCVAEVHGRGLRCWGLCVFVIQPNTHRPVQYSIDRIDKHLYNTEYSHHTHTSYFLILYSAENRMLQLNIKCS